LNGRSMASCVGNIRTENYCSVIIVLQVTADNVGERSLRHSVITRVCVIAERRGHVLRQA